MLLLPPALSRSRFIACYRLVPLLILAIGVSTRDVSGDEPIKINKTYSVALFTGSGEQNPFWDLFADFMEEAANDLGIKLETFYADGSRQRMAAQIREVCERADKPDGIVVQSFKRNGPIALSIANNNQVPVFLVNAGLTEEQMRNTGEPRTKLRFWIGEMMPDDRGAGYELANSLIDEARKDPQRLGPDGRVHVIALNGVVSDGASIQRVAGLNAAIADRRDEAVLHQVVSADWDRELARLRCRILHRRYPKSSVIWCASDHMAVGAIEAMRDRGLTPGQQVVIGGVDASPEAMKLIDQGTLSATIGGHFMEGGWVAVLMYDYFRGVDLQQIPTRYLSPMTLVTQSNLANYRAALNRSTWKRIDFRQFSHRRNQKLDGYKFDMSALSTDSPLQVSSTHSNDDASIDSDRDHE